MKTIFTKFLLGIFLLGIPFQALAQATDQNGNEIKTCDETIQDILGSGLDNFFGAVKAGDLKNAYYNMTNSIFREGVKFTEFQDMVSGAGLQNFVSRDWIYYKRQAPGVLSVTAEFRNNESSIHTLNFTLIKDHGNWIINDIAETPLPTFFKGIFPKDEKLKLFTAAQIQKIELVMNTGYYYQLYKTLSKQAKQSITLPVIRNTLLALKNQMDIKLSDISTLQFEPCSPVAIGDGVMVIRGSYQNDKFLVRFRFEYKYEWVWKLNGFSFTAMSL